MPDQLDQPGAAPTEGVNRAIEWIRAQSLLHQHGQPHHSLTHIGHAAGEIDPNPGRQRDQRSASAPRTRRSARPSTCAYTGTSTSARSTISISPSGRDDDTVLDGDDADGDGASSTEANCGGCTGIVARKLSSWCRQV